MSSRPFIDYTNKDYDSLREAMLDLARERLPEWTDHSPADLGVVLVELFATMGDMMFYYLDRLFNESFPETARERQSLINHLRLIGYELHQAVPASADLTLLFKDDAAGTVTIPAHAAFQTTAKATGEPVQFQYVGEPLTIDLNLIPANTPYQGKAYKQYETLPVTQVDANIAGEILGSSDASPYQRYSLTRQPLIADSLVVMVDEGAGPKVWSRRETLLNSTGTDEHYMVLHDASERASILFGDDRYGKIPRRGRNNLTVDYLTGGRKKGNVAPYTITKIVTPLDPLKVVFNKLAASNGADPEASEDAVRRGPRIFRSMGRTVTAQDYENHALMFGVGKARARAVNWNRIDLYIAPSGGGYPSDTLKEDLLSYFEARRIMTSILTVQDPQYVPVVIEGTLEVEAYFYREQVRQRVENAIRALLDFDNVDFQEVLFISKVYEAIEAIEGVKGVNVRCFALSSQINLALPPGSCVSLPSDGTLRFGWNEIPVAHHAEGIRLTKVVGGRVD